jgi:hypothetical protein
VNLGDRLISSEITMEKSGAFLFKHYRPGFEECLADLCNTAPFLNRDVLQFLLKARWNSKCKLCVLLHESQAYEAASAHESAPRW